MRWPNKLFERGQNSTATGVAEDNNERSAEAVGGKLDAANLRRRNDVARDANDEQVTQALIEHDLRRDSRIGASENDGEWLLAFRQSAAASVVRKSGSCCTCRNARRETAVPFIESLQGFFR